MKNSQKKSKTVSNLVKKNGRKGKVYIVSTVIISLGFLFFILFTLVLPNDRFWDFIYTAPLSVAAPVTISSSAISVEAENMSTYSLSGGLQTFEDITASGNSGMMFSINTKADSQVQLTYGVRQLIVRAKGEQCKGGPEMVVSVGGMELLTKKISASSWRDYVADVTLPAGSYNFSVAFTNDFTSNSGNICDRNLMIDKVVFQ